MRDKFNRTFSCVLFLLALVTLAGCAAPGTNLTASQQAEVASTELYDAYATASNALVAARQAGLIDDAAWPGVKAVDLKAKSMLDAAETVRLAGGTFDAAGVRAAMVNVIALQNQYAKKGG